MSNTAEDQPTLNASDYYSFRRMEGHEWEARYVYLSKKDPTYWGFLLAVNYRDAQKWLGSTFYIKKAWIHRKFVPDWSSKSMRHQITSEIFKNKPAEVHIGKWDGEYLKEPSQEMIERNL